MNTLKQLLTVLAVLSFIRSEGQQIELTGSYGASFIGGETIRFAGKDSFYFGGFYCTWGVEGRGRCEISNGYLFLYFEKAEKEVPATSADPIIVKLPISDSDFVLISVRDMDGNPPAGRHGTNLDP